MATPSIPMIVQGNTYSLALPLRIYIVDGNQLVLEDYTPDPTDEVIVKLQGDRRVYTYTPTIEENVATIALGGYELVGHYAVIVSIVKADGNRLKSCRYDQLVIVESIDELTHTEIIEGVEEDVIYLSPQTFIAGKDGRGIVSIEKTDTAGLVDTYTITYTDNTTSTFEVTNGKDGEDGQPGTPGSPGQPGSDGVGIVSITKTATSGLVDTYTILLTNGNTTTFQVTNGKDGTTPDMSDYYTKSDTNTLLGGKQDTLVSGTNIKKINNASVLGGGNISLTTPTDLSNYCPIIEDTRSSAVAAITGVAPFASLQDGQRIILNTKYITAGNTSLQLTLSDGTTTSEIPVYFQINSSIIRVGTNTFIAGGYYELIYEATDGKWVSSGHDYNTTYSAITQAEIDAGSATGNRVVTPALLCDNFSKITPVVSVSSTGDVSQTLDPYKWYSFGELDSLDISLTAPASGKLGEYFGKFSTSASWDSLSVPSGVTEASGNDTIAASKTYEFNIVDNKIMVKEV